MKSLVPYLILILMVLACVAKKDMERRHELPNECPKLECNCNETWENYFELEENED